MLFALRSTLSHHNEGSNIMEISCSSPKLASAIRMLHEIIENAKEIIKLCSVIQAECEDRRRSCRARQARKWAYERGKLAQAIVNLANATISSAEKAIEQVYLADAEKLDFNVDDLKQVIFGCE